jgi:hypothetical protein
MKILFSKTATHAKQIYVEPRCNWRNYMYSHFHLNPSNWLHPTETFFTFKRMDIDCQERAISQLTISHKKVPLGMRWLTAGGNFSVHSCLEELFSKGYYSSKVLWEFLRATMVRCQLGSSTREEESITSYSCFSLGWGLLLATGIGTRYKEPWFYISFEGQEQLK